MTILHLSDTHSQHRRLTQLPDADILYWGLVDKFHDEPRVNIL